VVAAKDHRDRAAARHCLHRPLQGCQRRDDVAGVHLDVTGVPDHEVGQPVGPQGEARPQPVVRQVVRHPDGLRPEARTRAMGGPPVERCTQDDDVDTLEMVEVAALDPEERDVRAELAAVARHGALTG